MALTGQRFSRARGAAAGVAAGAGALGGFAVPWWTGAVADSVGIGAALLSLTGFTLMIAFLSASLRRTS
jgi:nitrate/nitrite transporter NarK